ncbi:Conserved_hypothetical protein [Hexamita inflata]|uniref:Uncharacterized protein n=1 Tax=Hexamita inflata TaxID=28002 RepID=A0AA86QWY6_9EUKA|nr:Conserved hypothetical protein [Hexamita inflata]
MAKIVQSSQQPGASAQGFIVAEKNIRNDPDLKLLCAFVRRWGTEQQLRGEDYDCRYMPGRNRVADVVRTVLTYLPPQNYKNLITETLGWVALKIAESHCDPEKWFTESFLQLIKKQKCPPAPQVQQVQQSSNQKTVKQHKTGANIIDMTQISNQELLFQQNQEADRSKLKSAPQFPIIIPKPKQDYNYGDRSVGFYKLTNNPQAEPQAILADAQQQLVHGDRYFILEKQADSTRPGAYESAIRINTHVRGDQLDVPFHQRLLSAPNTRRENKRSIEIVNDFKQNGVYEKLDDADIELNQQHIYQIELDKEVNQSVKAYNDGRAKAKTFYQQLRENIATGSRHMKDQPLQKLQYVGGSNTQRPLVHDIDDEYPPVDQPISKLHDELLDKQDDYTGLGIGALDKIIDAQFAEVVEEIAEEESDIPLIATKEERERRPGYIYRQTVAEKILDKISVPQFDYPQVPLPAPPAQTGYLSGDQKVKADCVKMQYTLLQGGKQKLDPKIYQVTQTVGNLFSNEDLGLKSESDSDLPDSEPSDQVQKPEETQQFKRSEQVKQLSGELKQLNSLEPKAGQADLLLKNMGQNKSKVLKKEKDQFDKDEAERIRELKKKNADKENAKAPKPKTFKSKVAGAMAPTASGAPCQVEKIVEKQKMQQEAVKTLKQQANTYIPELERLEKKDAEMEAEYANNFKLQQRQTSLFSDLALAAAMQTKENQNFSTEVKQIVGATLFGKPTEEAVKTKEQLSIDQNLNDIQKPYVYAKPVQQEALERIQAETKSVTQNTNQLLTQRAYLPIQPASREPNTTRPEYTNLGRVGQTSLTRSLNNQPVQDVQMLLNTTNPPGVIPKLGRSMLDIEPVDQKMVQQNSIFCTKPVQIEEEAINPVSIQDREVMQRQVYANLNHKPNVIPSNDPLLLYQKQKKERQIKEQLEKVGINVRETNYQVQNQEFIKAVTLLKPVIGYDPFEREGKKPKAKKSRGKSAKK